jgi:murein DD-endopeptidase MepM/ murein hydrolase activator NlpD
MVGPATFAALRRPPPHPPVALAWPLRFPRLGDRYGPRGARFHSGVDLPAPSGTTVRAAGSGRVVFAGWLSGWGNLVVIAHPLHERTRYAHLSAFLVRRGARVVTGTPIGHVGATGDATGPHLHFEVVVRNANVNPLLALP